MARRPRAFRSACCARDSCLRGCRPTACPARSWSRACNRGLEGRLLAVVAGAGYGKTTLLVQALESSPLPWVWVSCDPRLRTPEMLLAHVAAGVAGAFPGVATALPPGGSPDDQMAALANEIVVTIPDDFVLALDDVHALDPGPVRDTLGRLASDLPPNVHLAITGRRDLGIPTSRAAAGGATVIDEGMLAFSFSEAAELLEDAPGGLLETEIGELHQRTEGWVSGLLLATRSGGGAGRAPHVSTAGPHFDYLADEVLAGLPEELQRFLLDTSVLERFTPPLAAAVSERPDARDVLRDLVASHLFIVQAEGDWYRYHHLFGAFLRRRLAEREPARLVELHGRAARAWEAAGDNQEAVRHFLEAGALAEAARALEPVAESMVATPERQTLAGWLQRIPPEEWRPRPRLQLAHALLTYLGGDARAAFEAWDGAIDRLMEAGEVERAAGALYRSQLAMLTVGVSPAVRVALAERHLPRLDGAGPAGGLARMIVAVAYAIGGKRAEAEELIGAALAAAGRRELALLDPCAEMVRGFYFDYADGHLDEALRRIEDGLSRLEPIEVEESFMLQAFGRGNRALILADTGRYEDCLREAQSVLDLSASLGMRSAPSLLILWWRLLSLCGLGDWEGVAALEAEARRAIARRHRHQRGLPHGRPARPRGGRAGRRRGGPRAHRRRPRGAARLRRLLRDPHGARGAGPGGGRRRPGRPRPRAGRGGGRDRRAPPARLVPRPGGAAVGEHPHRDPARGRAAGGGPGAHRAPRPGHPVAPARAAPRRGAPGARAAGRPPRGRRRPRASPPSAAARCCTSASSGCRTPPPGRGWPTRWATTPTWTPRPSGCCSTTPIRASRAPPSACASCWSAAPRQPIRIETFGGLRLYRAGDRVPDSSFGRAKARALMGALVCAEPRGVHRDRLLEHLWPELPPERGTRALDTTLHELRRTLEPLAPPRSGGSLVHREGEVYRLALGERDSWDAGDFLRLARAGEGAPDDVALERMLRAEALWRGDFLPDFPYEPWGEDARRELERARLELLERLARTLAEMGRPGAAIERYRHLVELDGEREGWHRALMRAYAQAGERPLALRQFHACRATLRSRLGIEPSAETRELYSSLL